MAQQETFDLNCSYCNLKVASVMPHKNDPRIKSFSSFVLLFPDAKHNTYRFICGNCGETTPAPSDVWAEICH